MFYNVFQALFLNALLSLDSPIGSRMVPRFTLIYYSGVLSFTLF